MSYFFSGQLHSALVMISSVFLETQKMPRNIWLCNLFIDPHQFLPLFVPISKNIPYRLGQLPATAKLSPVLS